MNHRCIAVHCPLVIPAQHAMCGHHWRLVPTTLQRAIWDTYVPGQTVATASLLWTIAADDAVASVAAKEGHKGAAALYRESAAAWREKAIEEGLIRQPVPVRPMGVDARTELQELLELGLRVSRTLGQLRAYWANEIAPAVVELGDDAWRRLFEVATWCKGRLEGAGEVRHG